MSHPLLERAPEIAHALLSFYARHKRPLPWRQTKDPYRIWVSEIMLQQTQVQTVLPYYERFLERFPTLHALAHAPLDDVLKAWEGLGYYARARHLHQAAQLLLREHQGQIPPDKETLLRLPGVGRYTAGAILSIAFGQDEPALDANARRVLSRLFAVRQDPRKPSTEKLLEDLCRGLIPRGRAGEFNQALMDLGSTICLPQRPKCLLCPLSAFCEARRRGVQDELPLAAPKRPKPHYEVAVGVIWKGDRVFIARRPDRGLLGGLWEFPGGKRQQDEPLEQTLVREIAEETGMRVGRPRPLTVVEHAYSHFSVTLHVFECEHVAHQPKLKRPWRWVKLDELRQFAFPAANQRILEVLNSQKRQRSRAIS
ncbi:MAG: A/G-specific adenine glycosylase [Candidatus Bipolaricaulota bacterium]|nr:A/G-specific adenine glycosylase [Candidatus Bipolaricaulota bacterium]MCS7274907.1 A/G-specific adenine glycosylase [Candidatus Bipolaricaulota bacterium]MDW8110496.1 A/G-specific adenine glycosylase [Candidatus Bipolaricaulota bacterium]MDW8329177.1 A/G-specific adenine glycosylase [Candidatus Bipolaricaulota bacterium]